MCILSAIINMDTGAYVQDVAHIKEKEMNPFPRGKMR